MKHRTRGSILIVVVGMLGLLILLTVSVGRRANQELGLIKYSLQKVQARYLAWGGFYYALNAMREDALDEVSSRFDNSYTCGFKLAEDSLPESLFKEIKVGNGWFNVTTGDPVRYGMGDEDGKLNLNALTLQNDRIFAELLMIAGVQQEQAERMAADTVDWMDENTQSAQASMAQQPQQQQAEGPFGYDKKQFSAKNRPFDQVYELMFIDGMTPAIYEKIKPLVTVFPRRSDSVKINLATAPLNVLLALAKYSSGPLTNTSRDDADSLISKLMAFRIGEDRIIGTADDQTLEESKMPLTMSEQVIFRAMSLMEAKISRFLAFRVSGFEGNNRRQSTIDAVIDRETLTVVSWRNN